MRLMTSNDAPWIWLRKEWPNFVYDEAGVSAELANAYRVHGIMEGKASTIGLASANEIALGAMAEEVLATAAIEGEQLSMDTVRSSVRRRLGLDQIGPVDRNVDGLVAVVSDATQEHSQPLTEDRLCRWQSALFPGGTSGIHRIATGRYRDHDDPMQIVSGMPGREKVHYEAPRSTNVPAQMATFLDWFNTTAPQANAAVRHDGLARAGIAHLWFESIHPFEDGNGRIGRAIVDMAVAQHLSTPVRLFSLSRQLLDSRADYYENLNLSQRGDLDVTRWVRWFAQKCAAAYAHAGATIDSAIMKKHFMASAEVAALRDRQKKVLRRLLDDGDGGFQGGLNAEKYMKMTGASKATATRDLSDMVKARLMWTTGAGKALRYYINVPGWTHGVDQSEGALSADRAILASLEGGLVSSVTAQAERNVQPSTDTAQRPRRTHSM
jgi:Fic family protein